MLLITRPREQAHEWVLRLRSAGVPAQALPLLGIHPAPSPQAVAMALERVLAAHYQAVMFVSPNAVTGFFAAAALPLNWPSATWVAAPGPGTAQALRAAGVPGALVVEPAPDAVQFDSESLWLRLAPMDWQGRRVLVVRGEGGRDWLIDRWREAGAQVDTVAAYQAGPPQPTPQDWQRLQEAVRQPAAHIWLLSSSQAVAHLPALVEQAVKHPVPQAPTSVLPDVSAWHHFAAASRCLATHPRIQATAQSLGLQQVMLCKPDWESVVASYNQLHCDP